MLSQRKKRKELIWEEAVFNITKLLLIAFTLPTFTCHTFLAFISSLLETKQMSCLDTDLPRKKKQNKTTHICLCASVFTSNSPIKNQTSTSVSVHHLPVRLNLTHQCHEKPGNYQKLLNLQLNKYLDNAVYNFIQTHAHVCVYKTSMTSCYIC